MSETKFRTITKHYRTVLTYCFCCPISKLCHLISGNISQPWNHGRLIPRTNSYLCITAKDIHKRQITLPSPSFAVLKFNSYIYMTVAKLQKKILRASRNSWYVDASYIESCVLATLHQVWDEGHCRRSWPDISQCNTELSSWITMSATYSDAACSAVLQPPSTS
jgi:hypothetical protein